MKNYFYRIKVPKLFDNGYINEWEYKPIDIGYIQAESKADARKQLETDYNSKMCQRSNQSDIGVKNIYLIQIYDPNPYYDEVWNKKHQCTYCANEFTKLDRDRYYDFKYIRSGYCSSECDDKANDKKINISNPEYDFDGKHKAVIYRIFNKITNKSYIGQTTQAFTLRWYQHFFVSSGTKFRSAIVESSLKDWCFEIIETFDFTGADIKYSDNTYRKLLNDRESYWINFYNCVDDGFNTINPKEDNNVI